MLQTFTTDDARQPERFDYLFDFLRSRFFDMEVRLADDLLPVLRSQVRICASRDIVMAEVETTAIGFERVNKHISRAPSGMFMLCKTDRGAAEFNCGGRDAYVAAPGDLSAGSADLTFKSDVIEGDLHRFRVLALPEARLNQTIAIGSPQALQPMPVRAGVTTLLSNYHDALWRELEHLDAVEESVAADTIAQLLAISRGTLSPNDERGRTGVREARLQFARDHIEGHLQDPALSPATVAAVMRISVRQLHLVFEPTGTSFARYLQSRRLERARLKLLANTRTPVIAIAFACGFESLTTFNRGFRAAFGMSPTELRMAQRD